MKGPSGSPVEDAEPGFPMREVWGWRWRSPELAFENREPRLGKPGFLFSGT